MLSNVKFLNQFLEALSYSKFVSKWIYGGSHHYIIMFISCFWQLFSEILISNYLFSFLNQCSKIKFWIFPDQACDFSGF